MILKSTTSNSLIAWGGGENLHAPRSDTDGNWDPKKAQHFKKTGYKMVVSTRKAEGG